MRLLSLLLLLAVFAAAPGPLLAKGEGGKKDDGKKKEEEKEKRKDAKKEFLVALGKSFKASDAAAIGKHFRTNGKIGLKLEGVKNGDYRGKQALNVLKEWFKGITPTEVKLSDHKGSHGKYGLKYKKSGKAVKATLKVFLEKEEKTWRIKGIEES